MRPIAATGLIGRSAARVRYFREREAPEARALALCSQRPGLRKDPGLCLFHQPTTTGSRIGADRNGTGNGARSLTTCRKPTSVLADGSSCTFADVAQWVERGHALAEATSSRLVIRSTSGVSMHSEAARMVLTARDVRGPWARPRAARHHVRRDARAWAQPKWIKEASVELALRRWKSAATIGRRRNP